MPLLVLGGLCLGGNKFGQQVDHQCSHTTLDVRMLKNILGLVCSINIMNLCLGYTITVKLSIGANK